MADTALTTRMRIDMDTQQAVANIDQLAKRSVPVLGTAFRASATDILHASGAMGALGKSAPFLSQGLTQIAMGVGMMNPLMLAATVGVAALTAAFVTKEQQIKLATKAVNVNADALVTLINKNAEVAAVAEQMRQNRIAELETERSVLEAKLKNSNAARDLFDKEMQQAILRDESFKKSKDLIALEQFGNATTAERANRLAEVIGELVKLNSVHDEATKKAAELAKAQERLNEANEEAIGSALADQLKSQADNAQKLLDIETQRAQLRARKEDAGLTEIIAASEAIVAAEQIAYETRLANANAFDGSRQVIEAQFTFFVEQEEARRLDAMLKYTDEQLKALKAAEEAKRKVKLTTAQVELRSAATTAAQMLLIQKASLTQVIATVIAEQEARLAALAVVALVEGIYYSITNPAAAASKFAAAAMAGAGAASLAAIGTAFTPRGGGETIEEQLLSDYKNQQERDAARQRLIDQGLLPGEGSALAGTDARSGTSGRTLVQQGPLTLNYRATMIVNGNVFDIQDVYQMWQQFNANQLRAAGVHSDELRKA